MKEATIPFAGFYYSIHDGELDQTLERMFADRATGCHPNHELERRASDKCRWHHVHVEYARAYAEAFGEEFKIPSLEFSELSCPKEYNFTTDRIFVRISEADASRLRAEVDEWRLRTLARERFTSRSGFISFYSPDVDEWGDVAEWDANQLGTLLHAYANQECNDNEGFDQYGELALMESAIANGEIEGWIGEATPDIARLYRVHDYLETRAERAQ